MADKIDSLVEEVGKLTTATTDLINTVNTSKVELDTAVTSATNHATSATNQATVATQQATKATQQATSASTSAAQAKSAATNAVAVTTGGTASLTAAAGKIPIGNSKGAIDIKWTPLLAAMYPHSGVIGSIVKEDLFTFSASKAADANKVTIKASQFNINGRWVSVPLTIITLQEAESTADRSVAFDDIFVDWDGNVQAYRSITPHRTGTGYDRDKIATEHGYAKVQKGLYKSGDTYALLLGRIARRNKGAYHPVFNSEGATGYWAAGATWGGGSWYTTSVIPVVTSTAVCFDLRKADNKQEGMPFFNGGSISSGNIAYLIRPDNKPYDAIYAEDFTPMYYSAKNVVDRQALLFDSFNCAVGGETFSGAEGSPTFTRVTKAITSIDPYLYWIGIGNNPTPNSSSALWFHDAEFAPTLNMFFIHDGEAYFWLKTNSWGGTFFCNADGSQKKLPSTFAVGTKIDLYVYRPTNPYPMAGAVRPQYLMGDIIGSMDAMPDLWKTEGIPGNWLAFGEEGESLIPDGTQKNYKLSRGCLDCYLVLMTADKGVTWRDVTNTYKNTAEGAGNTLGGLSIPATEVYMVFYKTSANPFEYADKSLFLCGGDIAAVNEVRGVGSNLIGKVGTSTAWPDRKRIRATNLPIRSTYNGYSLDGRGDWGKLEHGPINLGWRSGDTPSVKVMGYLSGVDDVYQLQLIYKEMRHNDTQWGDDNKFNIVNNQTTVTDLNGEKVIVGQKRVELPYLFDGVTY